MPKTCFVCEYKRLARQATRPLQQLAHCLRFIDLEVAATWEELADGLRNEFTQTVRKQAMELAYWGPDGDTAAAGTPSHRLV